MITLTALPAGYGDSLLIDYGPPEDPHLIIIDGGLVHSGTQLLEALKQRAKNRPDGRLTVELLIVTHIDADHIGGILHLLRRRRDITFKNIWFNGLEHLPDEGDLLGTEQADELSELINDLVKTGSCTLNGGFPHGCVMVPDAGPLPEQAFADGLKMTVLSPYREQLVKLRSEWPAEEFAKTEETDEPALADEGDLLGEDPMPTTTAELEDAAASGGKDTSVPNASSIGTLLSYRDVRILLGADCVPSVLIRSLERLGAPVRVNAFKLPHHGSDGNVTIDLLDLVATEKYIISTNGDRWHHPDIGAVARVILRSPSAPTLYFNYEAKALQWRDRVPEVAYHVPAVGQDGAVLTFGTEPS